MALGTTADFSLTRDGIISQAFNLLNHNNPSAAEISEAANLLNLIIRELDPDSNMLHAITKTPSTLTLVANKFLYTVSDGIQNNIMELRHISFRDSSGEDTELKILSPQGYEAIKDKFETGDVETVYLTNNRLLTDRQLYINPAPNTVNAQSEVIGTDALNYRCIRSHTADSDNKPITGTNYLLYWEQAGSSGATWVDGTSYTAPELLRYTYRKPLFDFDTATDDPDVPALYIRKLVRELADDLSDSTGASMEVRQRMAVKAAHSEFNIQNAKSSNTTDYHDKATYF